MSVQRMKKILALILLSLASIAGITVKPCASNKVLPHRSQRGRTFGYIAGFLTDLQSSAPSADTEPLDDDCDDIGDYNDMDLSSLTPPVNFFNRREDGNTKLFLNLFRPQGGANNNPNIPSPEPVRPERPPVAPVYPQGGSPPQRPPVTPQRPPQPQRPTPTRPQRPSTASRPTPPRRPPPGGYFGGNYNYYSPQRPEFPSESIKPVNEDIQEEPFTYRPMLTRPTSTRRPTFTADITTYRPYYTQPTSRPTNYYSRTTTQRPPCSQNNGNRPCVPEKKRNGRVYSNSIIGSFFDLAFN